MFSLTDIRRYLTLARPDTLKFLVDIIEERAATGMSSRAMASHVLGMEIGRYGDNIKYAMPYDSGDWGRCVNTYLAAPKHLQKKMEPIMQTYYDRLLAYTEKHGGDDWRLRDVKWPL